MSDQVRAETKSVREKINWSERNWDEAHHCENERSPKITKSNQFLGINKIATHQMIKFCQSCFDVLSK